MARRTDGYVGALKSYRGKSYKVGSHLFQRNDILKAMQREFEFAGFKSDEQELLTLKVLNGESVLGIMATGSGKSLAFLLPALLRRETHVSLIVSPLRALMTQFDEKHNWVAAIHTDVEDRADVWRRIEAGKVHVLLVAPERLKSDAFKARLITHVRRSGRELGPFVLDEVHCVSDWGHDFRPEYWWAAEHLADVERRLGAKGPIQKVMLTATADDRVRQEIFERFGFHDKAALPEADIIRGPAARPEIYVAAMECRDTKEKLRLARKFLERQACRSLPKGVRRRVLVYTYEAVEGNPGGEDITDDALEQLKDESRLKANELAELLERKNSTKCKILALPYASKGMNAEDKKKSVEFFVNASPREGQVRAIVATSAFGMGMDYDKIPAVVHFYPRPTLSEYWQQIGRVGRGFELDEGEWAEALALFTPGDCERAYWQASPPALDGIINAFTIPALGLLVAWDMPPGSSKVALVTPKGYESKFARFLAFLQEIGVLGKERSLNLFPRAYGGAWGYPVNHRVLKRVADSLKSEAKERGFKTKHYRKYIRYLRVAAQSKPKEYVILNQGDYDLDRNQTVLSRVTRWADIGAVERDYKTPPLTVRFRVKKVKFTRHLVNRIREEWEEWAEVKRRDFEKQEEALAAAGHEKIVKLIHKTYGESAKPRPVSDYKNAEDKVPEWLKE